MIQEIFLCLKGVDISKPIVSCGVAHRFLVAQQLGELVVKTTILLVSMAKIIAPANAAVCYVVMQKTPKV